MAKMWAAAALATAIPSAAAEAAPAAFRSGGVEFQVPPPAGYCLPRGDQIDVAQLLAAGDPLNVTHLTLLPCAEKSAGSHDYIVLKTPKEALLVRLELAPFLKEIGAAFDSQEFKAGIASGTYLQESGKSMSAVMGTQIDLTGDVRPLGKDDRCAYIGGTLKVAAKLANYTLAVGMCMTVVAGRLITINWYGPDTGSRGVAELLMKSKRLAAEMSSKPAS
jgi:hypothetical protein